MARETVDLYQIGKTPDELQAALITLRADFDAHVHDGASSRTFETISAETVSARTILIRKTSYDDTAVGIWMGIDNTTGVMKLKLGSAASYLQWDGSSLSITGSISATSGTIGGFTIGATSLIATTTGSIFATAASGSRVEFSNNQMRVYNGSVLQFLIGNNTIEFYDGSGVQNGTMRGTLITMADASVTFDSLAVDGTIQAGGNITSTTGAITAAAGDITGNGIKTNTGSTYDIGASGKRFNTIYLVNAPDVSSDVRLKTNIKQVRYGLKDLMYLSPVEYTLRSEGVSSRRRFGFIAQELYKIIPDITSNADGLNDELASIRYEELIPVLVRSLQEINQKLEAYSNPHIH